MVHTKGRRRRSIALPEITLTPLIDIALTLLVIFMITAPMMHSVITVDVPKAKSQAPQEFGEDSIVLNVGFGAAKKSSFRELEYSINNVNVTQSALDREVSQRIAKFPRNHTIYICADKSLSYDDVIKTFDRVSAIKGVDHVALVTQKTS